MLPGSGSLTIVPHDGLKEGACPSIVEKIDAAVDRLIEADAPQRRRAPLAATRFKIRPGIRQTGAHIVKQQVGERVDFLPCQLRDDRIW
jgi:hypothetical protein